MPLHIPPLRERRQDIRPLVQQFLSRAARYLGITRHTLLYRMEKHHIARPGSRGGQAEEEKADKTE